MLFYNILHVSFLSQALIKIIVVTFTISRQRGLGELKGGEVRAAHARENIQICVC